MTLAEALAANGITYVRDEQTAADQRMTWRRADGSIIGRFDAPEGWNLLRQDFQLGAKDD